MNVPSQFPYFVACMSADRPLGVGSLQGKMSAIMSETPSEPADSARVWCQRLNLNDPPSSTSVGDDLEMVRHMGDRCENAGNWKYHMKMRNTKIKTENARCENDGLTFLPPPWDFDGPSCICLVNPRRWPLCSSRQQLQNMPTCEYFLGL